MLDFRQNAAVAVSVSALRQPLVSSNYLQDGVSGKLTKVFDASQRCFFGVGRSSPLSRLRFCGVDGRAPGFTAVGEAGQGCVSSSAVCEGALLACCNGEVGTDAEGVVCFEDCLEKRSRWDPARIC